MSLVVLPRLDFSYLADERWGATTISGVAGVWSVVVALAAAIATVILCNRPRLPSLRQSMDAGGHPARDGFWIFLNRDKSIFRRTPNIFVIAHSFYGFAH